MGDANLVGGIVRILEMPKYKNKSIPVTQFRVQFPQFRKPFIVYLTFWGNSAHDVINNYKINDYILIYGYISLRKQKNSSRRSSKFKKVEIAVLKEYRIFG